MEAREYPGVMRSGYVDDGVVADNRFETRIMYAEPLKVLMKPEGTT